MGALDICLSDLSTGSLQLVNNSSGFPSPALSGASVLRDVLLWEAVILCACVSLQLGTKVFPASSLTGLRRVVGFSCSVSLLVRMESQLLSSLHAGPETKSLPGIFLLLILKATLNKYEHLND